MKDYYKEIQGWFDFPDLYQKMIDLHKDGSIFVEIGVWKGKSAAYMAQKIIESNKKIELYCVDTWQGSKDEYTHINDPYVKSNSLYEHFKNNMKSFEGHYKPIVSDSVKASENFKNHSIDFVFIDAGHLYEQVKKDLQVWIEKVKPGGYIGGHDCNNKAIQKAVNDIFPKAEVRKKKGKNRIGNSFLIKNEHNITAL